MKFTVKPAEFGDWFHWSHFIPLVPLIPLIPLTALIPSIPYIPLAPLLWLHRMTCGKHMLIIEHYVILLVWHQFSLMFDILITTDSMWHMRHFGTRQKRCVVSVVSRELHVSFTWASRELTLCLVQETFPLWARRGHSWPRRPGVVIALRESCVSELEKLRLK